MFPHALPLDTNDLDASLLRLPARAGVLAVEFADDAEPYLSATADIRRRAQKLLHAATLSSRRLSLRTHARRVSYALTASALEAQLLLYRTYRDPRRRLKLRPPPLIRFAAENRYPRTYISTRLSLKTAHNFFGPFASRVAAESYLEAVLDLFLLRRCQPDLEPDPVFPGCIYSEMHKCLAPCFAGCTDARYADEAAAVREFLATRGATLLAKLAAGRDAASAALEFERAAELHARCERVKAVAALASEIARPVNEIEALILEPSALDDSVNFFVFRNFAFTGPLPFSTLGMRHASEQNSSSSLFAQPLHLVAVPEAESPTNSANENPDIRVQSTLEELTGLLLPATAATAQDALTLLRRWYFRPATQRTGEIFLRNTGEPWPVRRILRAVSRVYLGRTRVQASAAHAESPQSGYSNNL